jgi:hypothetical protein
MDPLFYFTLYFRMDIYARVGFGSISIRQDFRLLCKLQVFVDAMCAMEHGVLVLMMMDFGFCACSRSCVLRIFFSTPWTQVYMPSRLKVLDASCM